MTSSGHNDADLAQSCRRNSEPVFLRFRIPQDIPGSRGGVSRTSGMGKAIPVPRAKVPPTAPAQQTKPLLSSRQASSLSKGTRLRTWLWGQQHLHLYAHYRLGWTVSGPRAPLLPLYTTARKQGRGKSRDQAKVTQRGHCYQNAPGRTLQPPLCGQRTSAHLGPGWPCESLRPWKTPRRS